MVLQIKGLKIMHFINSRIRKFTSKNAFIVILISFLVLVIFAPSSFATSSPIDFSSETGASISLSGFCANRVEYIAGMLSYSPYNISGYDFDISLSYSDTGFNQIQFDSMPCSDPLGVTTVGVHLPNDFSISDGQYLNIDIVSNGYSFPIFQGATFGGTEPNTGAYIPAFIDNRTYDVLLIKDSIDSYLARDVISGIIYGHKFDGVNLSSNVYAEKDHLQFSIPYDSSLFTSNGLSQFEIGTSVYLDGHLGQFGNPYFSPLFYLPDYSYSTDRKIWLYVSVTDSPAFEDGSVDDQWSADYQATLDYINEHANSAGAANSSLNGVTFNVLNPFSLWLTSFTDSSCYNFSVVTGWFGLGTQQICSPWSSDIRNIITPIVSSLVGIMIFGFVVNWLKGKEDTVG